MKDQSEQERGTRKSNRARTPNSFYTQGINELKRQPRPPRQPHKVVRKKSKHYQQSEDVSYMDGLDEPKSDLNINNWYPCKLPNNNSTVRVQFLLNTPLQQESVQAKKVEAPSKTNKKGDATTDLLSLFQMAIQNVNQQEPANGNQQQQGVKEQRARIQPIVKQRRPEDPEGKITGVSRKDGKLVLQHSKLGEVQMEMEGSEESEGEAIEVELVEEYRNKLLNNQTFQQLSLFH